MTGRQHVVFDVDQLQGVAGGVAVLGDDERDLLALEADLVGDEHGLHVGGQRGRPGEVERHQVLAGDDGQHLRVGQRLGGVDRDQPGMGHGGAQDGTVQHAGQHDVVDVVALAADEPRVLLALDAAVPDRAVGVAGRRVGCCSWMVVMPSPLSAMAAPVSALSCRPLLRQRQLPPGGWAAAHCTERTMVA